MTEPHDVAEIRARIARCYTGNRSKDLAQFSLGREFEIAEEEWGAERAGTNETNSRNRSPFPDGERALA